MLLKKCFGTPERATLNSKAAPNAQYRFTNSIALIRMLRTDGCRLASRPLRTRPRVEAHNKFVQDASREDAACVRQLACPTSQTSGPLVFAFNFVFARARSPGVCNLK